MTDLTEQLKTWRREFHQTPETSMNEYHTTTKLKSI